MNSDVKIQLFLRNIVLDALEIALVSGKWEYDPIGIGSTSSVPVFFYPENIQWENNKHGISIMEDYSDNVQTGYTDFTQGAGYYYLNCVDQRGTGLRLKRFVYSILLKAFPCGVYEIDDNTAISIVSCNVRSYETGANDDKIHLVLSIEFNKFDNLVR